MARDNLQEGCLWCGKSDKPLEHISRYIVVLCTVHPTIPGATDTFEQHLRCCAHDEVYTTNDLKSESNCTHKAQFLLWIVGALLLVP